MSQPTSPLLGDQPLKIGAFAPNANGGITMTEATRSLRVSWEHQKKIAQSLDRWGFDVTVPIARWKGFGGSTNFNGSALETFTWAAGIAEATENIAVVATTHVATLDPVVAAKMAATVDHISGGRFGLNVVMGWNSVEMAMMQNGLLNHEERYAYGAEWLDFVERLWSSDEAFDVDGKFFRAVGCESEPKPLQDRPVIINAGNSKTGLAYSAKYADINFFVSSDLDQMAAHSAALKKAAREEHDREIQTMTAAMVICRDTEAEARRVHDEILEKADWVSAQNLMAIHGVDSDSWKEQMTKFKERFILAHGATSLVGTPEQVVDGLQQMADHGMQGVLMGFLNYAEEIDYIGEKVLPLMQQAGLRK
ncbi:LLM class flavin-dependent oxidoreductase [Pseudonocardia broussonetiae]|uniref:LLM class flavin-dependent oxidoreductase n=1 Tax=Pseudonocardia broussonetiae TaxID=2736640 RepID=A0A6M6JV46_9PSEU|nr:LLM class flavin-dependent oxidoreductase [Pseudonocardia broussonetiae]QJY50001.1 LLM class flavin-dependent oxidoreductase [Pseudonocardia broussonetiae]